MATPLQPLPANIVVGVDIRDRSARNLTLADRFLLGVKDAGVAVGSQPTVLLHVTTSLLGAGVNGPSRTAERSYPDLSGVQAGMDPAFPGMSKATVTTRPPPRTPPLLFLRIDASEGSTTRTIWVASVQCQVRGNDDGRLAQELGRIIGGALGQRIERRPL